MDIYYIVLAILFCLAIIDLIVGVSNDAVNFLNSAIGSKVASFKVILIVASLGVLAGSLFSSGMMEVAKNGIFNPSFFTFDKVMIIFLAVMLTDIILLDFYNSLGLPTSTTVSIVFELLGSALIVGILYSADQGLAFGNYDDFINLSSAITIIVGIFLSVFISFIIGTIVQHISRILFTFNLKKSLKRYGSIFSGLAITTIIYFLLIKGAKGSSFITDDQVKWIMDHTWVIVLVSFISLSILVQVLMWTMNINPLKIVVLLGTFALAMAFAGNDLVNFIGVAVAGLSSFQAWIGSGIAPNEFNMAILQSKVATPTWILLGSGLVMVLTLWFNAKSRKVTETEVSLGRQDEGDEKFKPNFISRALVGSAVFIGTEIQKVMPPKWNDALVMRFDKGNIGQLPADSDKPSFDLIRASVNLLTASVVIAYGTSQKLPLSTTFVTFMVAMGTSFADQAWGRESAVYRVAGVINVIAGWLVTALVALTMSGVFAMILYKTGMAGMLSLTGLAAFFLIRSHIVFKRKTKEEESGESKVFAGDKAVNMQEAIDESKINTTKNLKTVKNISLLSIKSLISEDREVLRKSKKQIAKLSNQNDKLQSKIIKYIRKMDKGNLPAGRLYLLVFDLVQDLYQSALLLSAVCEEHVINHHPTPNRKYVKVLSDVDHELGSFIDHVVNSIEKLHFQNLSQIENQKNKLMDLINHKLDDQVNDIQNDQLGNRMGMLQTRLLLETRDIVAVVHRIYLLYYDFANSK